MKTLLSAIGSLVVLSAALAQSSAPAPVAPAALPTTIRRIELPPETGTYRPGPGLALANTYCLNCHSVEYCQSQPPLPEKYWDGTVRKMKEKFGATLPDEAIAPLVKYLTEAYGIPAAGK
jgi:sulfite dehydrogenase (cytochrome) subunit B